MGLKHANQKNEIVGAKNGINDIKMQSPENLLGILKSFHQEISSLIIRLYIFWFRYAFDF